MQKNCWLCFSQWWRIRSSCVCLNIIVNMRYFFIRCDLFLKKSKVTIEPFLSETGYSPFDNCSTKYFTSEVLLNPFIHNPQCIAYFEMQSSSKTFLFRILVGELEGALRMTEEGFQNKYGVTKPLDDGEQLVFHCHAGIRSLKATMIARSLGYEG